MTKALFRKQMLELFNVIFKQGRRNRNRSVAGVIVYAVLLCFVLVVLGRVSYSIANMTCEMFVAYGSGWGYFAVMGIIATAFGVLTSVFSIYTTVYQAKDNELLLSMPIAPRSIVLVRLLSSYVLCFVYELVVMLPVYLVYWKTFSPGAGTIALDLLILIVLPVMALFVCCVVGWILAAISTVLTEKLRNVVNFILTFLFVVLFLNLCLKASTYMEYLDHSPSEISWAMRVVMYPFMKMGMASQGDAVAFLVFLLVLAVLAGVIYGILSVSFLKLATFKRSGKKSVYREKEIKTSSVSAALFRKEFHRYRSSASYFMNSSIGSIIMLLSFVLMLLNWKDLSNGMNTFRSLSTTLPILLSCEVLGIMIGMNTISASSVSLEGGNVWILQSSPVKMTSVLCAKLDLHLLITYIPLLLCICVLIILMKPSMMLAVLFVVIMLGFSVLSAELGLAANVLFPKMDWVSESNAVRHSTSSRIALFGSWAIILIAGIIYSRLPDSVDTELYLWIVAVLVIAMAIGLYLWLMKKGSKILSTIK